MANYKAGDVIRLTRNAVGMTREELSDGICSVETRDPRGMPDGV